MKAKLLLLTLYVWHIQGANSNRMKIRDSIREMIKQSSLSEEEQTLRWLSNKQNHTQKPPQNILTTLIKYNLVSRSHIHRIVFQEADDIKFDPERGWILMSLFANKNKRKCMKTKILILTLLITHTACASATDYKSLYENSPKLKIMNRRG